MGWLKRLAVTAIATLGLSGCADFSQNLAVSADGTATLKLELAVAASMLAMTEDEGASFCSGSPPFEGVTSTSEMFAQGADQVCRTTFSGTLDAIAAFVNQNAVMPKPSAENGGAAAPQIRQTLNKLGDNWRFDIIIPITGLPQQSTEPGAPKLDPKSMMLAMVADRAFTFSVTAPAIIETTGQLTEDGKTASFSLPLAMLIGDPAPDQQFAVVFSPSAAGGPLDFLTNIFR